VATLVNSGAERVAVALRAAADVTASGSDVEAVAAGFRARLEAALTLSAVKDERLCAGLTDTWTWLALFGRLVSDALMSVAVGAADRDGSAGPSDSPAERAGGTSFDSLGLAPVLAAVFRDLGLDEGAASRLVGLIRMLRTLPRPSSVPAKSAKEQPVAVIRALLKQEAVRAYMGVNIWDDVTWFNRESFGQMLWWMLCLEALSLAGRRTAGGKKASFTRQLGEARSLIDVLTKAAEASGYQLDKLEAAAAATGNPA
jgi:hypothetical protein